MEQQSAQLLESFTRYCQDHPNQRFWQALRNWARVGAILATAPHGHTAWDTFHSTKQTPTEE